MNAEVLQLREATPAAPKPRRTKSKAAPAAKAVSAKTVRRTRLQHWSAMLLGLAVSKI